MYFRTKQNCGELRAPSFEHTLLFSRASYSKTCALGIICRFLYIEKHFFISCLTYKNCRKHAVVVYGRRFLSSSTHYGLSTTDEKKHHRSLDQSRKRSSADMRTRCKDGRHEMVLTCVVAPEKSAKRSFTDSQIGRYQHRARCTDVSSQPPSRRLLYRVKLVSFPYSNAAA